MKKFVLFFVGALVGVGFALGQAAPLPEQTIAFDDLEAAFQTKKIQDFVGKDLTVTGIHWFEVSAAVGLTDTTLDGQKVTGVGRTLRDHDRLTGGAVGLIFWFPDSVVRKNPTLAQVAPFDRLTMAHVHVAKMTKSGWAGFVPVSVDEYVLVPLDTFQAIDTKAIATATQNVAPAAQAPVLTGQ